MVKALACIALLIALTLASCGGASDGDARDLQARLAAMLDDPAQCPSGTSVDIQALINAAGPDGAVQIPAGCYQITDSIGIPAGKRVFGAGMEETILYRDPDTSRNGDKPIFWIFGRGEGGTQVSGIAFLGVRDTDDRGEDYGIVLNDSRDFRVDHCYFEGFGFAAVRTEGTSRGVIDHSIFVDNFKRGIDNLGYGVAVYGDSQWADHPGAGTADAVFVEDSAFLGSRHAIASNAGATMCSATIRCGRTSRPVRSTPTAWALGRAGARATSRSMATSSRTRSTSHAASASAAATA